MENSSWLYCLSLNLSISLLPSQCYPQEHHFLGMNLCWFQRTRAEVYPSEAPVSVALTAACLWLKPLPYLWPFPLFVFFLTFVNLFPSIFFTLPSLLRCSINSNRITRKGIQNQIRYPPLKKKTNHGEITISKQNFPKHQKFNEKIT